MKTLLVITMMVIAGLYLLNPTAGVFELLPDNLPGVGNLDEGLAAFIIYSGFEYFRGKRIGLFRNWK